MNTHIVTNAPQPSGKHGHIFRCDNPPPAPVLPTEAEKTRRREVMDATKLIGVKTVEVLGLFEGLEVLVRNHGYNYPTDRQVTMIEELIAGTAQHSYEDIKRSA